jgi:hypothetical protein
MTGKVVEEFGVFTVEVVIVRRLVLKTEERKQMS